MTFWSCKNDLIRKIRLISKFMTAQIGKQTIMIHILANISKSKDSPDNEIWSINSFTTEVPIKMKNSPLICRATQWTGFYMIRISILKELTEYNMRNKQKQEKEKS